MTAMSSKAEQYKQAGNAAFANLAFDLALANFTTAIQLDPSRAAYPLNRAAVYLKLQDWTRAEKDATTALQLDGGVNLKAWYRRAVARTHLGRLQLAKQDLEDAKRHGAGADVDAQLAIVLQQLGETGPAEPVRRRNDKLDSKQSSPHSQAPTAPTSDRLRAALAEPASSTSPSSSSPSSSASSLAPTSSKPTPARGDDLLNPVSTRRLAKQVSASTKTAAAASFAAKKEARLVREKEMVAATRRDRDDDASSSATGLTTTTTAPVTVSESSSTPPVPPIPSTSSSTPVVTFSRAPAQATTTMSSSSSSSSSAPTIGMINSPTALEAHFLALNARQVPRGDPERYGPLRRLAREHSNTGSKGSGSWREWMGQAGLTPDLLSEVVGEVVALFPPPSSSPSSSSSPEPELDDRDQQHLEWVLALLEGLTTCHRWDSASLFLEGEEREAVKRVLERARRRVDEVAGRWGV